MTKPCTSSLQGSFPHIPPSRRQVAILALEGSAQTHALLAYLDPPQSADEAIKAVSILLNMRRFDDAFEQLERGRSLISQGHFLDLAQLIAARRQIS